MFQNSKGIQLQLTTREFISRVATLVPKVMLATANSSCLEYKKDKQSDPFSIKDFGNLVRDLLRQKAYLGHDVYWQYES